MVRNLEKCAKMRNPQGRTCNTARKLKKTWNMRQKPLFDIEYG
jgi:hypothetical protein